MFAISRQAKELHITPKSLKVAKTPEEHKLLSNLSKVKSLWEGNSTHGSQGSCSNPETIEELDPTEDVDLEQGGSVGHSVSDTTLPEKREAWVTVTEAENENDSTELVRMTRNEQDESAGEAPNNIASLTERSNVVSSETVSKEERSSSSGPVASEEKLEDQSAKCDQAHSPKSEQRPSFDSKGSKVSEEVPRKNQTRRGGRGRKPKGSGPRHNENANKTPERQEKTSGGNTTKSTNTPTRSHHQKGRDDFKGDVPNTDRTPEKQGKATGGNASKGKNTPTRSRNPKGNDDFTGVAPKASPKRPRVERSEGNQDSTLSADGGAESTPRQLTKTVQTSEKGGDEKGTPDAKKRDSVKNTRTGNPTNSPGDSSKGGAPNRRRRRPRSRTSKGVPGDEKQDTRNRSNSTPEKRPPKNP